MGKLRNETIAAAMCRFNVAGRARVIVQRFSQLPDAVLKNSVTDERARPNRIEHLLLVDELSGMFEQYFQNSKSLGAQRYCSRALPQALVGEVEPKLSEGDVLHNTGETGGPMILRLDTRRRSRVAKYCGAATRCPTDAVAYHPVCTHGDHRNITPR